MHITGLYRVKARFVKHDFVNFRVVGVKAAKLVPRTPAFGGFSFESARKGHEQKKMKKKSLHGREKEAKRDEVTESSEVWGRGGGWKVWVQKCKGRWRENCQEKEKATREMRKSCGAACTTLSCVLYPEGEDNLLGHLAENVTKSETTASSSRNIFFLLLYI